MTTPLAALWLLLRPSPIPPGVRWWRYHAKKGIFGLAFLICLLAIYFITSDVARLYRLVNSSEVKSPESLAISESVYQQVRELNLQRDILRLAQENNHLDADVALVGPQDMTDFLREILSSKKVNFVPESCRDCILLNWVAQNGWETHYVLPESGEPSFDPEQQTMLLVSFIRQGVAARDDASTPLLLDEKQTQQAIRSAVANSTLLFPYLIVIVSAWLLIMSMGLVGYRWDIHRSTGKHEPWVSTAHDPWLLYTSVLLRQTLVCFLFFGCFLAVLSVQDLPLSWPWLISVWAALPFVCFVVGQWSVFSTVLFHHPNGRMFARFALSPITIGLVWSVRLMVIGMALRWKQPVLAWKNFNELYQSWYYPLLIIPCLVLLSVCLAWITHLRMGSRRQGLRKAVSTTPL